MNDFFFSDTFKEILISLSVQYLYCINRGHFRCYRFLRVMIACNSNVGATSLMY